MTSDAVALALAIASFTTILWGIHVIGLMRRRRR
jgi:hypothetical protein